MLTINELNALESDQLLKIFGNVVEKYPDIVPAVMLKRPFDRVETLFNAFADRLENLPNEEKLKILQLHPILAGAAADRNELTAESTAEQKSAHLHSLESDKKKEFNALNAQYMEKFKFPFVICARENKAQVMMEQIKIRLLHSEQEELMIGIGEVKKICALRVMDLIKNF